MEMTPWWYARQSREIRKFRYGAWTEALHARGYHGRWTEMGSKITGGHKESRDAHSTPKRIGGKMKDVYTAARAKSHNRYVNAEMKGHAQQDKPEALFTSGGAASGKSFITEKRAPKDAVRIDADRAKSGEGVKGYAGLPEYRGLQRSGDGEKAASYVHEESSHMSNILRQTAMARGRNMVVDSVGNSDPTKFVQKISEAQAAGYKVRVEHMHLNIAEARSRAHTRSIDTGRDVPHSALTSGHLGSAHAMLLVAMMPDVEITIWSSEGKGKTLVARGMGGPEGVFGLEVYNKDEFKAFLRKAQRASSSAASFERSQHRGNS